MSKKSRNTLSKTQTAIKNELQKLNKSSQTYQDKIAQLIALKDQPDLRFYYTISLFERRAETHPREAKKMIEALLSFDIMWRSP